jgi:hypothetical protein
MQDRKYVVVLLYVDDILIMAEQSSDRKWTTSVLGMTIVKSNIGYMICMKSYIDDTLELYGKILKEYTVPVT